MSGLVRRLADLIGRSLRHIYPAGASDWADAMRAETQF